MGHDGSTNVLSSDKTYRRQREKIGIVKIRKIAVGITRISLSISNKMRKLNVITIAVTH